MTTFDEVYASGAGDIVDEVRRMLDDVDAGRHNLAWVRMRLDQIAAGPGSQGWHAEYIHPAWSSYCWHGEHGHCNGTAMPDPICHCPHHKGGEIPEWGYTLTFDDRGGVQAVPRPAPKEEEIVLKPGDWWLLDGTLGADTLTLQQPGPLLAAAYPGRKVVTGWMRADSGDLEFVMVQIPEGRTSNNG